jgi:hypothetical protein
LATTGSCDTSVGFEVPEEVKSSVRFRFFPDPLSSESAGGDDKVDSLSSKEPSVSSLSLFLPASGASELAGAGSASIGLHQEDEGEKLKMGGPRKRIRRTRVMSKMQYKEITREVNTFGL